MMRWRLLFLLLFVATAALGWDALRFLTGPVANSQAVVLTVPPGIAFKHLARKLVRVGVFDTPRQAYYFTAYAELRGDTQKIRSGEYEIEPQMTPPALLRTMVAGKTRQYRLTVVEGWTFQQLRDAVDAHEAIRHTLTGKSNAELMTAIGAGGQVPEGRFLPDTYLFPRGTTDVDFFKRCYQAMQQTLKREWTQRADDLPLDSPYQALILASIVEKETGLPEERSRIAGVFVRRLRKGMALQTDPTVIYGLKDFDGNLRRSDLRRDTPYNTYTRRGLPPSPIALPGRAAVHASLHPAKGDALYFVSRGDGSHHFSATLAQHNKAVRKYQLNQ